jgi:PTH2 family peptidyl-tRNA hydrolase
MKQIIVMRKDLGMKCGKMCSQSAHASMKAYLENKDHPDVLVWLDGLFKKVCVRVESEEELFALFNKAKDNGLIAAMILDAGLTEFDGVPTNTCIAIGPHSDEVLDPITGHLKLL